MQARTLGEFSGWLSSEFGQLMDNDIFTTYTLPAIIVIGLLLMTHPLKENDESNLRRPKKSR